MKYTFYIIVLLSQYSYAQFTGGQNDGSSSRSTVLNDEFYFGGNEDGSASVGAAIDGGFFQGGINDGFALADFTIGGGFFQGGSNDGATIISLMNENGYFKGGVNDGFAFTSIIDNQGFYLGGQNDGSAVDQISNSAGYYLGGNGDGHFSLSYLNTSPFVWTGLDDSNWNNSYNWKYQIIPNSERGVLIPAIASSMPLITSGLLVIGENINGDYLGKNLVIEGSASLTIGSNGIFMNYGTTTIGGNFYHRNITLNSFQNFNQITIATDGKLVIKSE